MENREYKVVYVKNYSMFAASAELEKAVNKLHEIGWSVQGGVAISLGNNEYILAQAMVKGYDDSEKCKQQIEVILN